MPVIKKISVQKNNQERYNIFFETNGREQYAFSVSEDVLIKYNLTKGKDLSELEMQEIFYNEDIQKAYSHSLNYLSFRMRSEKEIMDYLKGKDYPKEVITEAIYKLKQRKYINDKEFAESFVKTQMNTSDKGPVVIERSLVEKGVAKNTIDEALSLYSQELQLEKAIKLCHKFVNQKKSTSSAKLKMDLKAMLVRKGYFGGIITMAIDEALQDMDHDQEWEAIVTQGEKALKKYATEPFKMKQLLYRKGFPMELIERFINERMTNED